MQRALNPSSEPATPAIAARREGRDTGYTRTLDGQALESEMTLVEGQRGNYTVWCQYGEHMSEQMPIGCQMPEDTLIEAGPSVTSGAP